MKKVKLTKIEQAVKGLKELKLSVHDLYELVVILNKLLGEASKSCIRRGWVYLNLRFKGSLASIVVKDVLSIG